MMQALRNNTKIIIWIIVIAFVGTIIFAWGMDIARGRGGGRSVAVVGVINGVEIPTRQFQWESDRIIESQRQQDPQKDFTDSDYRAARRDAWNNFIIETIKNQEIAERHIELTNNELAEFLRRYPPQEVYQIEQFQTEGQFDYQKYLQAMSDPNYRDFWIQLESLMRPQFRTFKLQEYIGNLIRVGSIDVQNEYIRNNERIKVNYALVSLRSFPMIDIEIDSQSVRDYYNSHPEEFFQEEQAQYRVIRIMKEPSERDEMRALEDASAIKGELDQGGDFVEIANERTEDPSGQGKGGDLGWFGPGRMVAAFDSAVFAMEVGEISPPVKTNFGYHIIRKIDTRTTDDGTEEVQAAHILIRPQVSQETLDDIEVRLDRFRTEVTPGNFDDKVEELGVATDASRKVTREGTIPGMSDRDVIDWLFTAARGTYSRVYDTQGDFRILRAGGVIPAGTAPLEEVYTMIERKLQLQEQEDMALARADSVYQEIVAGKSLEEASADDGVEYHESPFFSRTDQISGMGQDPNFIGAAFTLSEANRYSRPVITKAGAAVLEYVDRLPPKLDAFEQQRDTLRAQKERELTSSYWESWFTELIREAEIEDYRQDIYGEKM